MLLKTNYKVTSNLFIKMKTSKQIFSGTAHKIPADLRKAPTSNAKALTAWKGLTPLARNEWICWITFFKKDETRKGHVKRTISELKEGKHRPCCWPVISLANQKNYVSLYVCAVENGQYISEKNKQELGKVSVGKSCIRFKKTADVNLPALKKILLLAQKHPGLTGIGAP